MRHYYSARNKTSVFALLGIFLAFNCADVILTSLALALGAVELNILPPWWKFASILLVLICTLILQALYPRATMIILAGSCVLYSIVIGANFWTLSQLVLR